MMGINMGLDMALVQGGRAAGRPTSSAAGGAFALARATSKEMGGGSSRNDQPSERTLARSAGKKWNAATRSFV